MYTLRNIDKDGCLNHSLGESYSTVNRFENSERFRELFKYVFNKEHVSDLDEASNNDTKNVIGFVMGNNDYIIPIYQTERYYVMTDSGRTFERINKAMLKQKVVG